MSSRHFASRGKNLPLSIELNSAKGKNPPNFSPTLSFSRPFLFDNLLTSWAYEDTVRFTKKAKASLLRLALGNEWSHTIAGLRGNTRSSAILSLRRLLGGARLRGSTTRGRGRGRMIVRDSQRSKEHGSFHNFLTRDESSPIHES
jgi:hypothetical protein